MLRFPCSTGTSKTNMFGVFNWPGVHNKVRSPAHDLRVNGEVHSRYSPARYRLHSQLTTGTRLTIEIGVYINHNEVVLISPHGSLNMSQSVRTSNPFMLPSGSSVFLPLSIRWTHQTHSRTIYRNNETTMARGFRAAPRDF